MTNCDPGLHCPPPSQNQEIVTDRPKNDVPKTNLETLRVQDLERLFPRGRETVLEIGARDGMITRLLLERFQHVTALDLAEPKFSLPRCTTVSGDVTKLQFPDQSFDVVICTEVLEHVTDFKKAAEELQRVTRHELVIGVPFCQDTRVGRTTCAKCGKVNPPWGHVNSFSQESLFALFANLKVSKLSFVGEDRDRTNSLSTALLDYAGNPWGRYEQQEPCLHCGTPLQAPTELTFSQRVAARSAVLLNRLQSMTVQAHPHWIHVVFARH